MGDKILFKLGDLCYNQGMMYAWSSDDTPQRWGPGPNLTCVATFPRRTLFTIVAQLTTLDGVLINYVIAGCGHGWVRLDPNLVAQPVKVA